MGKKRNEKINKEKSANRGKTKPKSGKVRILEEVTLNNGDRRIYYSNGITETILKNGSGRYLSIPNR